MHLKMGDFIMGMGKTFATEAMDISEKLSLNEGNVIFSVGDAAGHFYVLLKGQVQLSLGDSGPVVYQARHPGTGNIFRISRVYGSNGFAKI
jgi:CRP-like cAMP-binding protein